MNNSTLSERTCPVCGTKFLHERRATCSRNCWYKYIKQRANEQRLLADILRNYRPKPASLPTLARPGSKAKIAVLQWRFENGEELFHPDDSVELILSNRRLVEVEHAKNSNRS